MLFSHWTHVASLDAWSASASTCRSTAAGRRQKADMLHSRRVRSSEALTTPEPPCQSTSTLQIQPSWPCSVPMHSSSSRSQLRSARSAEPVTARFDSQSTDTHVTDAACPSGDTSGSSSLPVRLGSRPRAVPAPPFRQEVGGGGAGMGI
ncbi:unnamed protein product [Prorocentrum cordatum]|uniref:Uncharacterized protein n=1 Tax=Prorocentrum cordatum TaxID=2364126 RepID=A0ABN9TEX2_9DINO|nr:unnamed protein product [Polarella glacialis]